MTTQTPATAEIKNWLLSGSSFSHIFDSGSGSERKRTILPESTPVLRIRSHLWYTGRSRSGRHKRVSSMFFQTHWNGKSHPLFAIHLCQRVAVLQAVVCRYSIRMWQKVGSWHAKLYLLWNEVEEHAQKLQLARCNHSWHWGWSQNE